MGIRIRQQCWDRVTEALGGLDSEEAAQALRGQGYEVEIIDGDWGASYYADTEGEHNAVQDLSDDR